MSDLYLKKKLKNQSIHYKNHYRGRYYIVIAILAIATLGLIIRLVDLTVINRAFLRGQGDARTLRTITIPAYRGMIVDRNNASLAISTPVDSVWINPKDFAPSRTQLDKLANLLNMPRADISERASKAGDKEFVYLKRGLDPNIGKAIKALGIEGLYLQGEYKRFYPEGEVTAHILGFTNVDDQGQEGLELAYNQWLSGVDGLMKVLRDRYGHIVQTVDVLRNPKPGQNLQLSIDRRIQYFAYQDLAAGIAKFKAKSGSVVVIDVNTGEILAIANWPSYNPNNRPDNNSDGRFRNRAVTDLFEPGSTIKTFSMAAALESGKYNINSRVDTSPGIIYVNGKKVDDDGHNNGIIDLTDILKVSSNVGMTKVTLSLPPSNWYNMLHKLGFGELTGSGFPGERSGLLVNYTVWDPFVLATLSFGYGLSVTTLQLAQAYTVLAADGVKRPITFLRRDNPPVGEQVMKPSTAKDIRAMLEAVLSKGGTAPLARVPGYRVTGKTGTTRLVGAHGYEKNRYNSIFVGIAPASHPRLVVAVMIHDPMNGVYYGGYVAGPIFSKIMGETLRLLNIPPDDLAGMKPMPTNVKPPAGMSD